MRGIQLFLKDDRGQDLIECALLIALLVLISAAIFVSAGGNVSRIWTRAAATLTINSPAADPGCPPGEHKADNGTCVRNRD